MKIAQGRCCTHGSMLCGFSFTSEVPRIHVRQIPTIMTPVAKDVSLTAIRWCQRHLARRNTRSYHLTREANAKVSPLVFWPMGKIKWLFTLAQLVLLSLTYPPYSRFDARTLIIGRSSRGRRWNRMLHSLALPLVEIGRYCIGIEAHNYLGHQ